MEEASRLAGDKTKKQIIHDALELFIKINKRKDIAGLAGKISFNDGFDPVKERRTGRFDR
jgi:hypothetical protein